MSKHGILATLWHFLANSVRLKNLLRWRADNIRPYERYEIFAAVIRWHHPTMAYVIRRAGLSIQKMGLLLGACSAAGAVGGVRCNRPFSFGGYTAGAVVSVGASVGASVGWVATLSGLCTRS